MEPWTRAVARITVGGFRGTGFLISADGLVLTAFHVIGDRDASIASKRAQFYGDTFEIRFGDPKQSTWAPPEGKKAELVPDRYSFEHDWALLRIPPPDPALGVVPLGLAKLLEPRAGRGFTCFGFPSKEADIGGEYAGTFGTWSDNPDQRIEAAVPAIALDTVMGGISGAPCVVDGQVVAMVLQALTDGQQRAVKSSLYVAPIERIVRDWAGLVWDRGDEMPFERQIEARLPDDSKRLTAAGEELKLPAARARDRRAIARGLLLSPLDTAAAALHHCQPSAEHARHILDHLGTMQLPADAVDDLRAADRSARPALVASVRGRIQTWYIRRSYADLPAVPRSKIALVRARAGEQESPAGSSLDVLVDELVAKLRARLVANQLGAAVIHKMLTGPRHDAYRFWAVVIDENRFDVLAALAQRLPNARVIAGSLDDATPPEPHRDLVVQVSPIMTDAEQLDRLALWESILGDFEIPVEPEEDL